MNSQDYWQKRESKHILEMINRHTNYEKEIHQLYLNLWDEIDDEIKKFYSAYAGKEKISIAEAKKVAKDHDVQKFARQAKKYVEERDFSKEANEQLRLYNLTMRVNRLELLKSRIGMFLTGTTNEAQKLFNKRLSHEAILEYTRQAGILGQTIKNQEQLNRAIQSIVDGSYHNATFSQRLWANQDLLKSKLDGLLTQSIIAGKHPEVTARQLRDLVVIDKLRGSETADYVARRLMISEATRIQSEVQKRSYEDYEVEEYDFVPESTACDVCKQIAKAGPYKTKDMAAGVNAGPIHNWCRCSTVPRNSRDEVETGALGRKSIDGLSAEEERRQAFAESYYNEVRNRKLATEAIAVAQALGITKPVAERFINHVFNNEYTLESGIRRFDPDYDMAQSYQRIREGKMVQEHDIIMVEHELFESILMENGMSYLEAHDLTEQIYNYNEALEEFGK